jgi:hypothetical protein
MLRPRRESDVRSLFGATPEQIRLKQYEDQMAFLNAQESGFGKAGAALGLGLASLFGGKSKEVQQAEARQGVRTDLRDTLALAEQEAAQRGMAPLVQDEVSLLNRRANELQTIAAGFRNLGEDTTEIENAALEARLNALKTKREIENEALRRKASELAIKQGETQLAWSLQDRPMDVAQQQLQFESARNNFTWAQEDRPFVTEANKIQAELRKAQLASAQGSLKDAEQARKDLETARTGAIDWLTTNNAEAYVPLVESNIFAPDKAITAVLDARKLGIKVNEIGPYTLSDGTEVIGALTDKGQLVQATDAGWQPISPIGVIQGRPSTGGAASEIKQGRSISGQVKKDYDTQFQSLVDTGIFLDTEQEVLIQQNTGIEDITSKEGKQELYRRAEQIFANTPGITEREALERALAGDRVTTPSTPTQAPSNKPDLSKVTAK